MQTYGYLHNELDVKILILFILARIEPPLAIDEIFEVAYQDESLNYFVFANSLADLLESGHLVQDEKGRYSITEKGRKNGSYTEDSLAIPVVNKVTAAINKKSAQLRRDSLVTTSVSQDEEGYWLAHVVYKDSGLPLMNLTINVPDADLGLKMAENIKKDFTHVYKTVIDAAIDAKKRSDKK